MPGPDWWKDRIRSGTDKQVFETPRSAEKEVDHGEVSSGVSEGTPLEISSARTRANENMPSTNNTKIDSWNRTVDMVFKDHRKLKEVGVHFFLMAGVSFCFIRQPKVHRLGGFKAAMLSLGFVIILSFVIEGGQELLPDAFAHGFALSDIWYSMTGGAVGTLLGMIRVAD